MRMKENSRSICPTGKSPLYHRLLLHYTCDSSTYWDSRQQHEQQGDRNGFAAVRYIFNIDDYTQRPFYSREQKWSPSEAEAQISVLKAPQPLSEEAAAISQWGYGEFIPGRGECRDVIVSWFYFISQTHLWEKGDYSQCVTKKKKRRSAPDILTDRIRTRTPPTPPPTLPGTGLLRQMSFHFNSH